MEETVQRLLTIVHLHACAESTKEPDEFDLWERDQSTISQIGDEFDSFMTGIPFFSFYSR